MIFLEPVMHIEMLQSTPGKHYYVSNIYDYEKRLAMVGNFINLFSTNNRFCAHDSVIFGKLKQRL